MSSSTSSTIQGKIHKKTATHLGHLRIQYSGSRRLLFFCAYRYLLSERKKQSNELTTSWETSKHSSSLFLLPAISGAFLLLFFWNVSLTERIKLTMEDDKSHCWDRMLDGTLDSIMMQILPDEVIPTSQQSIDDKNLGPTIALSSSTHCWGCKEMIHYTCECLYILSFSLWIAGVDEIDSGNWLEIEKCQLKNELSEISSSWARLNADVAKLATVTKESLSVDIEVLSYQLKEWGSRLVRLQTVIKPSSSTPNIVWIA